MNLVDIIKNIALDVLNSTNPVQFYLGRVTSSKPLKVRVHANLELEADFLIVSESLARHKRIVRAVHEKDKEHDLGEKKVKEKISVDKNPVSYKEYAHEFVELQFQDVLKKDDKVILARVAGGHQYIILDRYREGADIYGVTPNRP